jgi:GT2 family glycosyltransferase
MRLRIFLTDDGSSDGTTSAVAHDFPAVTILEGNGSLFWNGGMRLAIHSAIRAGCDYILLLNDDTFLFPSAVTTLFAAYEAATKDEGKSPCIVGVTVDERNGFPTYGGRVSWGGLHATRYRLAFSTQDMLECDTFNGNCVLIPSQVITQVGNLDPVFVHKMGDYDYGHRISKHGFPIMSAPGFVGFCSEGDTSYHTCQGNNAWQRLRSVIHPKRFPPRAWLAFTRRHAGPLWLLHWIYPYVMAVVQRVPSAPPPASQTETAE